MSTGLLGFDEVQERQGGKAPVLIRVDTKSGHGASNTKKQIESALKIHKEAIAGEVAAGITKGIKPVASEVDDMKGAMVIVARELGVEAKLPGALAGSVPRAAGEKGGSVAHVERQLRSSQIVQIVIALGFVAKVLIDLFGVNPH